MQEGDLVILYERHDSMTYLYLDKSKAFQNKFGRFPHSEMIGKEFGSKIKSTSYDGYVYALEPTPDLWSHALDHRTQIVDSSDASFVTLQLDLYPGCVVVESGTGSGNMTTNFARAVSPNGHVHTFEYNADRASMAVAEFEKIGLTQLITVRHGDVCGESPAEKSSSPAGLSYGFHGVGDSSVDAVFLDVPAPWLAVGHAKRVLKTGRSICTYSPCVEQVMKTCEILRELGFHSIKMLEIRQRQFDGRIVSMPTPDLGEGHISALPDIDVTSNGKELKTNSENSCDSGVGSKRSNIEEEDGDILATEDGKSSMNDSKRRRNAYEVTSYPPTNATVARPMGGMKGHTAFLTFAICPDKCGQE